MSDRYFPPGQEPLPSRHLPTEDELRAAQARATLKIQAAAMLFLLAGAGFVTVGIISIYSSYSHMITNMESLSADSKGLTPEYAWCAYAGVPLLAISYVLRLTASFRRVRPVRRRNR